MLLVPGYFAETMKTDEKRKILFELAGEFTDEDVFAANEELAGLMQYLAMPGTSGKSYTIDQWKSISSEERRKLNKDLELLPTRIDEVQKSIPENTGDEEELAAKLKAAEERKQNLEKQKLASINARGKSECSQDMIKAAETKAQDVEAELSAAESVRESTAQRLKNLKEAVVTLPPFETTEEYLEMEKRLKELESRNNENTAAENLALNYDYEIAKANIAIQNINSQIAAVKAAYEEVVA